MQIYLAQVNPTVGDLAGNFEILKKTVAANSQAHLIVFPELFLTGYPPKGLLLNGDFLRAVEESLVKVKEFLRQYPTTSVIVGLPRRVEGKLYNSAFLIQAGEILAVYDKRNLSPFRLFDENSYFTPGKDLKPITYAGRSLAISLGLELCSETAKELKDLGAELIINPAAVPYQVGRWNELWEELKTTAEQVGLPVLRVGQVGTNDELVFAGGTAALAGDGKQLSSSPDFSEGGAVVNLAAVDSGEEFEGADETAEIYRALVLSLRDYARKTGIRKGIIGISGGLDSAVSAVIACEALGAENIRAVTQPGPYTLPEGLVDAKNLAKNLGLDLDVLSINSLYQAVVSYFGEEFTHSEVDVAKENIQARLRGNLLMVLSNRFGGLVLTNSNKSELAMGYTTLYGDVCGGMAVLGDVYKTQVYQLAYYINREREIIPWHTIEKPPSAELRPNQRDDESLPPYDVLDGILSAYLDQGLAPSEIMQDFPPETVRWVIRTAERNEYKRRQAALIPRITTPISGLERQMPIAAVKEVGEI